LLTDTETDKKDDVEKVKLMTIHSAKGLEFDYVFIAGVEEDLFPNKMTLASIHDLEEERRLFYVALTRAGKQAYISFAGHRYKWGVPTMCSPSRFIKDIDEKYIQIPVIFEESEPEEDDFPMFKPEKYNDKPKSKTLPQIKKVPISIPRNLVDMKTAARQAVHKTEAFDADDPAKIEAGMQVTHQQFGEGKVLVIEGKLPNAKATVLFGTAGEKKLLLKFARLKIIS
jgi:DNA helicase II / ATP-dependent DNA helicase PcrA